VKQDEYRIVACHVIYPSVLFYVQFKFRNLIYELHIVCCMLITPVIL